MSVQAVKISLATLTYARTGMLEEAIESFLRQDYPDKEMVIYNTYERQHLVCASPGVRVINAYSRPNTLGETRNKCIEQCQGEFILNLDDDDIILPGYLTWLASRLDGRDWIRQDRRFCIRSGRVVGMAEQATNQTLFSKAAWKAVGGFPRQNSGEDKAFKRLLVNRFKGERMECSREEAGFCYRWHSNNISRTGPDRPGQLNGLQTTKRLVMKAMPRRGKITLHPRWHADYIQLTRDYLKAHP